MADMAANLPRVAGPRGGSERLYSVSTQRFVGDKKGRVRTLQASKIEMVRKDGRMEFVPVPESDFEIKTDLVLLAMGFTAPTRVRCSAIWASH
jgi:glutamate synthase (NADPH/NADH) small chain